MLSFFWQTLDVTMRLVVSQSNSDSQNLSNLLLVLSLFFSFPLFPLWFPIAFFCFLEFFFLYSVIIVSSFSFLPLKIFILFSEGKNKYQRSNPHEFKDHARLYHFGIQSQWVAKHLHMMLWENWANIHLCPPLPVPASEMSHWNYGEQWEVGHSSFFIYCFRVLTGPFHFCPFSHPWYSIQYS